MKRHCKLSLVAAAVVVGLSANAQTFTLNQGWNLAGANENGIAASSFTGANSLWKFDASSSTWQATSPNGTLTSAMSGTFDPVTTLNAGEGFWVNNLTAGNVTINGTSVSDATLNIVSGWQLAALKSSSTVDVATLFNQDAITTVWKFSNGDWQAYSPKANIQTLISDAGIASLTTLNAGDGFWVNASGNATVLDTPPSIGGLALTMVEKQNAVPFADAKVYTMDGTQIGTTDYKGSFETTGLADGTKVVLAKKGYAVAYGTVQSGSVVVMSQQDPNSKIPFATGDYTSAKPVAKAISSKDGAAKLVVKKMVLGQDVTVSLVPFMATMSVPTLNNVTVGEESVDAKLLSVIGGGYLNVQNNNGEPILPFDMTDFQFTASVEQNKILGEIGEILNGKTEVPSTSYASFSASAYADLQNAIENGVIKLYTLQLVDGVWEYVGGATIQEVTKVTKNANAQNEQDVTEYKKYKITSDVDITSLAPYAFAIKVESLTGDATVSIKAGGEKMFDGTIVTGPDNNTSFDWLNSGVEAAVVLGGDAVTTGPALTSTEGAASFSYKVPLLNPYIDLSLKKEGYYDTSVTCSIDQNGAICPEVVMYKIPTTASIAGHVKNKLSSEGIDNALVTLVNPEVLSADKIKLDVDDNGLPTVEVGYMPNVTYTWSVKKGDVEVVIKTGSEDEPYAQLSAEELYVALVDTFDNTDATDDKTTNPTGLWEVVVKAEHSFTGTDATLVEYATGSFNIDLLISKLASQMTGSLSENLTVGVYSPDGSTTTLPASFPSNATDLAIYGGKSIGFLYAKTSSYDSAYWKTEVIGAGDETNNDETWYGAVKELGNMQYVIPTPLESTKGWYSFTSLVKYLGNNFDAILAEDPTWPGVRWYRSGFTMATSFNKTFTDPINEEITYNQSAFSYMDLPDDETRQLRSIVEIPSINLVGESATAYLRQTTTATDGSYAINMIPADLSGALKVFAKAEGYKFDSSADVKLVNDLSVGTTSTYDLTLCPVGVDCTQTGAVNPPEIIPSEDIAVAFTGWTTNTDNCWSSTNVATWNNLTADDLNTMTNDFLGSTWGGTYGLLADADTSTQGYLWFGSKDFASYSGSSTNYGGPSCGRTLTPAQDLSNFSFPLLTFKTWFEIESVDAAKNMFDQMKVGFKVAESTTVLTKDGQELSLNAGTVYSLSVLNPDYEPSIQSSTVGYSSAGVDAEPVWIDVSIPTEMLAGLSGVQFVFEFNSQDSLYNGFRGWGIDSVTVKESMEDNLLLPPSLPELVDLTPFKLIR